MTFPTLLAFPFVRRGTVVLAIAAAGGIAVPDAHAGGDCSKTSVGLIPLNDLGVDFYQGFQGGLYPGGLNQRPSAHDAAGLAIAAQITPLDASGNADPNGEIGLMSIGMSNASLEWEAFIALAASSTGIDPNVTIANGAEVGQGAREISNPASPYWRITIPSRLNFYGLSAEQIQVVWLKEAVKFPTDPFPSHAQDMQDLLQSIVQILQDTIPNLVIASRCSRAYAGHAVRPLSPEPWTYEEGFAFKWLIEAQIGGDPALNYDPAKGAVEAPWLSWGPYLWADGLRPRSDGSIWKCEDFQPDGTHPDVLGQDKVARALLHHFISDPTATSWFLTAGSGDSGVPAEIDLYGHGTAGTQGVPRIALTTLPTIPTTGPFGFVCFLANRLSPALLVAGLQGLGDGQLPYMGGSLLVVPWTLIPFVTDARGVASLEFGDIADDPALGGFQFFLQAIVVDPLGANGKVALTAGLAATLGD